jgi:cytoskeletal protein CcmA (bactofilin family)
MIGGKKDGRKEDIMFGKEGEQMPGEGKMNSIQVPDTLVIGKDGRVKAEIKVKSAVVGGTVIGNIDAKEKIELQAGSRLEGDIKTIRLVIDEGVFFEGNCKMSPEGRPEVKPSMQGPQYQQPRKSEVSVGAK